LKEQLNAHFPGSPAISPIEDNKCDLKATRNVFARLLNGVPENLVCSKGASKTGALGRFIHIEQHYRMMQEDQYEYWTEAIQATFPYIGSFSQGDNPRSSSDSVKDDQNPFIPPLV